MRISTRQWAIDSGYDARMIFQKLFCDDIKYLLSMDKLWAKRRPPVPLDFDNLPGPKVDVVEIGLIRDQQMWSIAHCVEILIDSVGKLSQKFKVCSILSYFLSIFYSCTQRKLLWLMLLEPGMGGISRGG